MKKIQKQYLMIINAIENEEDYDEILDMISTYPYPNLQDAYGRSLIYLSVILKMGSGFISTLLTYVDPLLTDNCGNSVLHIAIMTSSSLDIIEQLCHSNLINTKNDSGWTPLYCEIKKPKCSLRTIDELRVRGGDLYEMFNNFSYLSIFMENSEHDEVTFTQIFHYLVKYGGGIDVHPITLDDEPRHLSLLEVYMKNKTLYLYTFRFILDTNFRETMGYSVEKYSFSARSASYTLYVILNNYYSNKTIYEPVLELLVRNDAFMSIVDHSTVRKLIEFKPFFKILLDGVNFFG